MARLTCCGATAQPFGTKDPYFDNDIGFYVFDLPWLHFVVDFAMALPWSASSPRRSRTTSTAASGSRPATGPVVRAGAGPALDAAGLLRADQGRRLLARPLRPLTAGERSFTGVTYTDDQRGAAGQEHPDRHRLDLRAAVLPQPVAAHLAAAVVGLALLVLSAILLGRHLAGHRPAVPGLAVGGRQGGAVHRAQHRGHPRRLRPDRRRDHAVRRDAGRRDLERPGPSCVLDAAGRPPAGAAGLRAAAAAARLLLGGPRARRRPLRHRRPGPGAGARRPGARPGQHRQGDQNWSNLHTVYTHGDGIVAAFANQRDVAGQATSNTSIDYAEGIDPGQDALSKSVGGYEDRIYFGEDSPDYSIVGKAKAGAPTSSWASPAATRRRPAPRRTTARAASASAGCSTS